MKTIMFPGQGSQYKGMGKDLFDIFKKETRIASEILDYDLKELCLLDPDRKLGNTAYTQPALYVINAFRYFYYFANSKPDYLIGHSLGEYNALLAAEVFDFETGLKLVQKRGALMAESSGGGMAAVLGLNESAVREKIVESGYQNINIANYNTPSQLVLAGEKKPMDGLVRNFDAQDIKIIPLFVSAPFHSPFMESAADDFKEFIKQFSFSPPIIPVISNVTARAYEGTEIQKLLVTQITGSVRWMDSIRFLLNQGVQKFEEIGGEILTKMVKEIEKDHTIEQVNKVSDDKITQQAFVLGNAEFRKNYNTKYAYYSGSMYRGIASSDLVIKMGKNKMLSFLGTGGMSIPEIEKNIIEIQSVLKNEDPYGINLLHNFLEPHVEMDSVQTFIKYGIRNVEASAFMQVTKSLVYYRAKGLYKNEKGAIECRNNIIAKVSRPEVAEVFMKPAPKKILDRLLDENLITSEQAEYAMQVPMSFDICVEADSGGHTDAGVALVLLPSMQSLRATIMKEFKYHKQIRIGLAGGIGTPQAVACAFIMAADFVVTGSINQCTVEAGISDAVKDLLQEIDVQDTDYAPAGDMFELGSKVQVLKKGVLFSARANKLYTLYNQYNSLDEIPEKTIMQLEKNYFKKSIEQVWEDTKDYLNKNNRQQEIDKALKNGKNKMAMVFRWYFGFSSRLAFEGDMQHKANFQIHTGPALGAFNQWAKGTELENWKNRHVDQIGSKLMEEAFKILKTNKYNTN